MARDIRGMHIVIVGASGVLGSKLATQLGLGGAQVSAIVRDSSRLDTSSISRHAIADITDSAALRAGLCRACTLCWSCQCRWRSHIWQRNGS